jgi:hypothetical protein
MENSSVFMNETSDWSMEGNIQLNAGILKINKEGREI